MRLKFWERLDFLLASTRRLHWRARSLGKTRCDLFLFAVDLCKKRPLQAKADKPAGQLVTFDQRPFGEDAGLAAEGAVYVPAACRAGGGCRVHIAFHGCQQSRAAVGDAFVAGAGFAAWADTNKIVVLFPQVAPDVLVNPLGCWDWWGYTGFDYLTRDAPQVAAVHAMVARLAGRP